MGCANLGTGEGGADDVAVWTGEECLWLMVDMLRGESLIQLLDVQFPLVLSHRTSLLPPRRIAL